MKYRPSLSMARLLAGLVADDALRSFSNPDWDLIVAVPSSQESFLARHFNPALEIALSLQTRAYCSTIAPGALIHLGSAVPQASLPAKHRLENVRHSFRANSKIVAGKEILLVDDVVTSGATSQACAIALLEAGACAVDLFSLCRSLTWPKKRSAVYYAY